MDQSNKLLTQLRHGLSWTLTISVFIAIANFGAQIWFARTLGINIIGQYALLVVVIELSLSIVNFGFNQSVIRHHIGTPIFGGALALVLIQAVVILIIMALVFCAYYIMAPERAFLLFLPGLILVFARILGVFSTLIYAPLENQLRYDSLSKARLISTFLGLFIAVVMAIKGVGIYSLVTRDFVTPLLLMTIVCYQDKPSLTPNFSSAALTPVWRFTLPIWGLNVLERGALRIDYALAGLVLGQDALGIYFQIRSLVEGVLGFIISPVQTVLFSFYCRYSNRAILFKQLIRHGVLIILIPAIILAIITLPFGKALIAFVLGEAWAEGSALLPGLMLYAWSMLWFENLKVMAISENLHLLTLWGRLLQILMLVILVVPLTRRWEFGGAGAATGFAAISLALLSMKLLAGRFRAEGLKFSS